jgi:hypothetical protein
MLNVRVYSLLLSSSPSINLKEEEEEKKKNKKKASNIIGRDGFNRLQ